MSRIDLEELRRKLWEVADALEHETRGSISARCRRLRRIMENVDASANALAEIQGIDPNLTPAPGGETPPEGRRDGGAARSG